jgi:hypothetical protein
MMFYQDRLGTNVRKGQTRNRLPVPPLCFTQGRAVIDALHKLGVVHMAKFMDEPRTEQEWQAWGYHLHGP